LPVLALADHVTLLQVTREELLDQARANLRDVARWLGRHGIEAVPSAVNTPNGETRALYNELRERRCDLFVAGAYGHSRVGEFVFGGVTRDMILDVDFPVLISH
jgi:nucleotide-binding universal stress UspA family protein